MIPFADFSYFGILLYLALPTIALGGVRKAGRYWILICSAALIVVQYWDAVGLWRNWTLPGYLIVALWAAWQGVNAWLFLNYRVHARHRSAFYTAIGLALLPLFITKFSPLVPSHHKFGFLGISYITFRALDLIFCIEDGVITSFTLPEYIGFLLFFPTISSGPIDRFRRFRTDWMHTRSRLEFFNDLGEGFHRIFRG